jgi:hypothetical protein
MSHQPDPFDTKLAVTRTEIAEMERDAALDAAAIEAVNRQAAQVNAVEAEITASQNAAAAREMTVERNLIREDLAAERHASASNAFGFYLMTGILIAILLVGGIYYYFHRQELADSAGNAQNISVSSVPAQQSAPPSTLTSPPPVVNVPPPHVRTEVRVVPNQPQPQTNTNSAPADSNNSGEERKPDNGGGDQTNQNR